MKPRRVKNSIASTWRENVERSKRKRRKKKAGPVGPAMARLQRTGYPRWRKKFSSAHRTGLDRIVGSGHNPNVEQKKEGVKKEQVKGCGSVNRPTPGSQRAAEPVASGFLRGLKIAKIRGLFSSLGVKLWVVDAGFPPYRAIPYGVKIGVAAIFEQIPASGEPGVSPGQKSQIWERKSSLFFLCIKRAIPPQKLQRSKLRIGPGEIPAQRWVQNCQKAGRFFSVQFAARGWTLGSPLEYC